MSALPDPMVGFVLAAESRHRADLSFAQVRRALQALSSLYVERRHRIRTGTALDGAGKRAAFALYYGPMHFLLVREIVRALGPARRAPRRILDLGCGTGTAGAAWALECLPAPSVEGIDLSGWAVAETRWTLRQLGLRGRAKRGHADSVPLPSPPAGILAAFTVNELGDGARARMLPRLLDAAGSGSAVLVVEPLSRRVNPWWPEWAEAAVEAGGREDEWRVTVALPEATARLARAAGLDTGELRGRSLALGFSSSRSAPGDPERRARNSSMT
jgi:SAM-dependent methyltransferase